MKSQSSLRWGWLAGSAFTVQLSSSSLKFSQFLKKYLFISDFREASSPLFIQHDCTSSAKLSLRLELIIGFVIILTQRGKGYLSLRPWMA